MRLLLLALAGLSLAACKETAALPDGALPDGPVVDAPPASPIKVAAIQYDTDDYKKVTTCSDNLSCVRGFIGEAARAGAKLVVTPEAYVLGQAHAELLPTVGSDPGTDAAFSTSPSLKAVSEDARQLQIYVVLGLFTTGLQAGAPVQNSQVAFGPDGKVVAVHHKFNLIGNEVGTYTPGTDVSVFSSPLGNVGLLVCADIYAEVDKKSPLPRKLAETLKARVVAVSSYWLTSSATSQFWFFAKSYKVYAVVANTTATPGNGGGIYDSDGAIAEKVGTTPSVVYAELPPP
jgi:predicted amidohydrolase